MGGERDQHTHTHSRTDRPTARLHSAGLVSLPEVADTVQGEGLLSLSPPPSAAAAAPLGCIIFPFFKFFSRVTTARADSGEG